MTDGETRPLNEGAVAATLARPPGIQTVFVHVWAPSERVFVQGIAAPDYKADPTSRASLDRLARATRGTVYSEDEVGAAARDGAAAPRQWSRPSSSSSVASESLSRPLAAPPHSCPWACFWAAEAADLRSLTNLSARRHTHRPALTNGVEEALRIWHVCGLEGG